ncbi:MAG: hypothetical protein HFE85_04625 [Clostridiales bacterium]|nr:hypothetical protein [Clostridiales bacterium]
MYEPILQRYCPVLGRNVPFEITGLDGHCPRGSCMNLSDCQIRYGGCRNRWMSGTKGVSER